MSDGASKVKIFAPEGMAYTCHNEGVCCHVFDTIPVDAVAASAMSSLDMTALNTLAGNDVHSPIIVDNPGGSTETKVARKSCGDCAMLTADKLCAIHAIAGEAAKPKACQDFPWRYVETPDGVYVGLSFVCPSVRANRGQLVSEQTGALAERYEVAASVREAPALVPLNGRVTISWSDYMAIEVGLRDLLTLADEPLSVRLIASCMLTGFVDQMLTQTTKSEETGNVVPVGSVAEIIAAMRKSGYSHILRVARKPTPPAPRSRRMFLGMFTSFANTLHQRDKGRLRTVTGVMGQYVRHAAGFGAVILQPLDARLGRKELDVATVPDDGYAADQISRYIEHCIWRKDLVLSGDLTRRVRLLALNAALIPWYATALAKQHNRDSLTDSDWDEAIGHVERLYGFHSAFYRFFEQNKAFSDIVDSFVLKPSYPFVLFR